MVVAGPSLGERRALLEALVAEFPDVFAFPRQHTTCPLDELRTCHAADDGDDTSGIHASAAAAAQPALPCTDAAVAPIAPPGDPPVVLAHGAFEAAAAAGRFLETHPDLFTHPSKVHQHACALEDMQDVIRRGALSWTLQCICHPAGYMPPSMQ